MFSFLGELISLLLGRILGLPRHIANEFQQTLGGCQEFFRAWLMDSLDSTQQTIDRSQESVGPPRDLLSFVRSFWQPKRLARVRVPARRSID